MSTKTEGIAFKETPAQKTSRLLQESLILLEEIKKAREELANIAAIRKSERDNSDDEILSLKKPGGKKSRRQKRSKKNKTARQRRHQ
jgi:hypothetical protein